MEGGEKERKILLMRLELGRRGGERVEGGADEDQEGANDLGEGKRVLEVDHREY